MLAIHIADKANVEFCLPSANDLFREEKLKRKEGREEERKEELIVSFFSGTIYPVKLEYSL